MGVATPAPFLFELVLWFSVASVTAWAWLAFIQRKATRVHVADEDEPPGPA